MGLGVWKGVKGELLVASELCEDVVSSTSWSNISGLKVSAVEKSQGSNPWRFIAKGVR
jgi:hypothetical protein